jgi:hypothetical protein
MSYFFERPIVGRAFPRVIFDVDAQATRRRDPLLPVHAKRATAARVLRFRRTSGHGRARRRCLLRAHEPPMTTEWDGVGTDLQADVVSVMRLTTYVIHQEFRTDKRFGALASRRTTRALASPTSPTANRVCYRLSSFPVQEGRTRSALRRADAIACGRSIEWVEARHC